MPDPLKIEITSSFDPKGTEAAKEGLQNVGKEAATLDRSTSEQTRTSEKAAKGLENLGKNSENTGRSFRELGRAGHDGEQIMAGLDRASQGGLNSILGLGQAIRGTIQAVTAGLGPLGIFIAAAGLIAGAFSAMSRALDDTSDEALKSRDKLKEVEKAAQDLDDQKLADIRKEFDELEKALDRVKEKQLAIIAGQNQIAQAANAAAQAQVRLHETTGELTHEQAATQLADLQGQAREIGIADPVKRAAIEAQTAETKRSISEGQLSRIQNEVQDATGGFDVAGFDQRIKEAERLQRLQLRLQDSLNSPEVLSLAPGAREATQAEIQLRIRDARKQELATVPTEDRTSPDFNQLERSRFEAQQKVRDRIAALEKQEADAVEKYNTAAKTAADAEEAVARATVQQARLGAIARDQAAAENEIARRNAAKADADEQIRAERTAIDNRARGLGRDLEHAATGLAAGAAGEPTEAGQKAIDSLAKSARSLENGAASAEELKSAQDALTVVYNGVKDQGGPVADALLDLGRSIVALRAQLDALAERAAATSTNTGSAPADSAPASAPPDLPHRASGGPVKKGQPVVINELGGETFQSTTGEQLFIPPSDGQILPTASRSTIPAESPFAQKVSRVADRALDLADFARTARRSGAYETSPSAFTTSPFATGDRGRDVDGYDSTAASRDFRLQREAAQERQQAQSDRARGNFDSAAYHESRAGRLDPEEKQTSADRARDQAQRGPGASGDAKAIIDAIEKGFEKVAGKNGGNKDGKGGDAADARLVASLKQALQETFEVR